MYINRSYILPKSIATFDAHMVDPKLAVESVMKNAPKVHTEQAKCLRHLMRKSNDIFGKFLEISTEMFPSVLSSCVTH